jgi:peptide/nickel transport system permease protein
VSILIFLMIHLVPGDPVTIMLHESTAGPGAIEQMRRDLGLDQPLPLQYLYWLIGNDYVKLDTDKDGVPDTYGTRKGILRGDFGRSIFKRAPVIDVIADKFPRTLKLAVAVMLIALPLALEPASSRRSSAKRCWTTQRPLARWRGCRCQASGLV